MNGELMIAIKRVLICTIALFFIKSISAHAASDTMAIKKSNSVEVTFALSPLYVLNTANKRIKNIDSRNNFITASFQHFVSTPKKRLYIPLKFGLTINNVAFRGIGTVRLFLNNAIGIQYRCMEYKKFTLKVGAGLSSEGLIFNPTSSSSITTTDSMVSKVEFNDAKAFIPSSYFDATIDFNLGKNKCYFGLRYYPSYISNVGEMDVFKRYDGPVDNGFAYHELYFFSNRLSRLEYKLGYYF